jgi:hypothetical protein
MNAPVEGSKGTTTASPVGSAAMRRATCGASWPAAHRRAFHAPSCPDPSSPELTPRRGRGRHRQVVAIPGPEDRAVDAGEVGHGGRAPSRRAPSPPRPTAERSGMPPGPLSRTGRMWLRARLRPMRGPKRLRSAQVIGSGHARPAHRSPPPCPRLRTRPGNLQRLHLLGDDPHHGSTPRPRNTHRTMETQFDYRELNLFKIWNRD